MTRYVDIVFMQDDDADEPLRILHHKTDDSVVWEGPTEESVNAALEYLQQWEYELDGRPVNNQPQGGSSDRTERVGDYLITYNVGLGYIGLEKIVEDS